VPFFDMRILSIVRGPAFALAVFAERLEFFTFAAQRRVAARRRTEGMAPRKLEMHHFEAGNEIAVGIWHAFRCGAKHPPCTSAAERAAATALPPVG
jgi:hypothetical protein